MFSKKSDKKSDSSSDSRRRKAESSSSKTKRTESTVTSNSSRDPERDDDRSKRTTTRTYTYPAADARSEASSYATASSEPQRTGDSSRSDKPRRRATDDDYEGSGSRRDRGMSDDIRGDPPRRSDRRERKESRRNGDRGLNGSDDYIASRAGETEAFNAQVSSPGFTQFPGQSAGTPVRPSSSQQTPSQSGPSVPPTHSYTDPSVSNQFPGQNIRPAQSVDEGGPGLAADYYGDQGESVFSQPGVRPEPKPHRQSIDSHLMTPTAAPMPVQDTGHGSAADYYSGSTSPKITPQPGRPPSSTAGPSQGPTRPPMSAPSGSGRGVATGAAAVAGGAALGYALGHGSSQSQSSSIYQTAQSSTSYQQNINASAAGPRPPSSQMPGGFPSPSPGISLGQSIPPTPQGAGYDKPSGSNLGAYAAGAAGLAAGAYALHEMNQNHQQAQSSSGRPQYGPSPVPPYGRPPSITSTRHRQRGPIDRFVDWWKDYEDVAKMEAYTEYIGVCADCFDPGTSPRDAPRKHHYHGRRSTERLQERRSRESLRKSGRVEKRDRYYASSDEEKKGGYAKWVAVGLAGAGLAKAAKFVGRGDKEFDDTYSIKSGRYRDSRESLLDSKGRTSSRTSHGVVRHRSSDMEGKTVVTERVEERIEKYGKGGYKIVRRRASRSRSRSRDRTSGIIGAAAGAALVGSAIASHERHKHRSRSRSPGKHRHSSSEKVSTYEESSRHGQRRHSRRSEAGSSRVGFAEGLGAAAVAETFAEAERERRHRHGKRSGGFFSFGNESTASIDTSLAYGADSRRHRRRSSGERVSTKRQSSNEKLNAALLGIGATTAALAAAQHGSKVKPVPRHAEVIAVRHGKSRHSRSPRRRRASGASASSASIHSDDEAWQDVSESESDSGLAFGDFDYKGKARKSTDSLVSNDSGILSKWGWRWGTKDKRSSRQSLSLGYGDASSVASTTGTTAAIAGAAVAGAMMGKHESSLRHEDSQQGLQNMQTVYPVPTNDPYRFDVERRPESASQQTPIYTSHPGSVPLQQPQPIAPVNGAVYAAQPPTPTYTAPTGQPVFSGSFTAEPEEYREPIKKVSRHESIDVTRRDSDRDRDSRRRRRASSPVQSHFGRDAAIAGIAAAATAGVLAAEKSREKKETRFELDREQQDRERRRRDEEDARRRETERKDRERRQFEAAEAERKVRREREREEEERQDRERERRHRERRDAREAERRADELERERVAKETTAKEEADQIERQRREEIARDSERKDRERREAREAREAERRRQREEREKGVGGAVAAGLAGAAAGAAIAAMTGKGEEKTDRRSRTEERREERRDTRDQDYKTTTARPSVAEVAPPEERTPSVRTAEPTVVEIKPPEPSGVEVDTFDDDFDPDFFKKSREERERDFVRKTAKIATEYNDPDQVFRELEERYRSQSPSPEEVFAPAGLHESATSVEKRMGPNADADVHIFRVDGPVSPPYEGPYAFTTPGDAYNAPWPIPRLNLIAPTPEPPPTPEVKPVEVEEKKEVPEEPLQRTVSGTKVTWGENQTHHYEVPTPEPSIQSLRDSYITDQDLKKHELHHQASDEIIIEEEEDEGTKRKSYRPRSPPSSERKREKEVEKDEAETPVDEEVKRFFPETTPGAQPEEEEQIYESHSPEVKPVVVTPGEDEERGFYQSPFFETVSDLGLGMNDGKRHGFVEGEVLDETPTTTPAAEKDYSKGIPGAFEEETQDGVTSAESVRRMNEEDAERMRHASTRDETETARSTRSDLNSQKESKRASRETERAEPIAEAATAAGAAAALGTAAGGYMRSKDSEKEEKRWSKDAEREPEPSSVNVFDYLEHEPKPDTKPRSTRGAEKSINAELQSAERRDRDSAFEAAQTPLPDSARDLRDSSKNGHVPLHRSYTDPVSTEPQEATADDFEEPSRRRKKKRSSKYEGTDRTASPTSEASSRSKVSRSRSEDDYEERRRSKGRSKDDYDEEYEKRKSKRRSTTDMEDGASAASSSKPSKSSKGGILGSLFGKPNGRTEVVQERSRKDEDDEKERRRKKKSRSSKDKDAYSDDDQSRVSSRSDERREKRRNREDRDRFDDEERERSRTDERNVSRYSAKPPEDVVEDVLRSPRDKPSKEERDMDQSFLGMRPEETVPLAASTAVALASATIPSDTPSFTELKPERKSVQFDLPRNLPLLPESRPTSPLSVGSTKDLPALPPDRPTSPIEVGSLADLPALPPDRPDSPYEHETPPRLSLQSQRAASTTAVPLRFRRPPGSPAFARRTSSPIQDFPTPTSTGEEVRSPLGVPWSRHVKTPSTDHKPSPRFSGSEFRPLYLMERSRSAPSIQDEEYPPLPPSRTPSVESEAEEESQAFQSAAESPVASYQRSITTSSPEASFHEARELQSADQTPERTVSTPCDYLGSQQTTPTATTFPVGLMSRPVSEEFETPQAPFKEEPVKIESPIPSRRRWYSRRPSWMGEDIESVTSFPSVAERFERLDRLTELPDSGPSSPVREGPAAEEAEVDNVGPREFLPSEDQSREPLPHMRPTTPLQATAPREAEAQHEPEKSHFGEVVGAAALSGAAALAASHLIGSRDRHEEREVQPEQGEVMPTVEAPVQPTEIEEPEDQPSLGRKLSKKEKRKAKKAQRDSVAAESEDIEPTPEAGIEDNDIMLTPAAPVVEEWAVERLPALEQTPSKELPSTPPTIPEPSARKETFTYEAPIQETFAKDDRDEKSAIQPSELEKSALREFSEEPTTREPVLEPAQEEPKRPSMAEALLQRTPSKKGKKKGKKGGKSAKSTSSQSASGTATPAEEDVQEDIVDDRQVDVDMAEPVLAPEEAVASSERRELSEQPISSDRPFDAQEAAEAPAPVQEELGPREQPSEEPLPEQTMPEAEPEEEFPIARKQSKKDKRKDKKKQKSLGIAADEEDSATNSVETAAGLATVGAVGAAVLEATRAEKEEESSASSKKGKGKGKKKRQTLDIWSSEQPEAQEQEDQTLSRGQAAEPVQPPAYGEPEKFEQHGLAVEPEQMPVDEIDNRQAYPSEGLHEEYRPTEAGEAGIDHHAREEHIRSDAVPEEESMECMEQMHRDESHDRDVAIEKELAEDDLPHKVPSREGTGDLLPAAENLKDVPATPLPATAMEDDMAAASSRMEQSMQEGVVPYEPEEYGLHRPRMPSEVSPRTMPVPEDNEELEEVPSYPSIAERFEKLDRQTTLPDSRAVSPVRESPTYPPYAGSVHDTAFAATAGAAALGVAGMAMAGSEREEKDPEIEAIEAYREPEEVVRKHLHRVPSEPRPRTAPFLEEEKLEEYHDPSAIVREHFCGQEQMESLTTSRSVESVHPELVKLPSGQDLELEEYHEPSATIREHIHPPEQRGPLTTSRSIESMAPEQVKLPSGEDLEIEECHEPATVVREHLHHEEPEQFVESRSVKKRAPELTKLPSGQDLELEEYHKPTETIREHLRPREAAEPIALSRSGEEVGPELVRLPSSQDLELEEYHEHPETIREQLHSNEAPERMATEDAEAMVIDEYQDRSRLQLSAPEDEIMEEEPEIPAEPTLKPMEPAEIEEPPTAPLSRVSTEPGAEDEWAETPSKKSKKGGKKGKKGKQAATPSRMPVGAVSQPLPKDEVPEPADERELEESATVTPASEPEEAAPEDFAPTTGKKGKKSKKSKRSSVVTTPAAEPSSPVIQASRDLEDLPITQAEDLIKDDEPMPEAAEAQLENEWAVSSKKRGKRGSKQSKRISLPSTPPVVEEAREAVEQPQHPSGAFTALEDQQMTEEPEEIAPSEREKAIHDKPIKEPLPHELTVEMPQEPMVSLAADEGEKKSFAAPAIALAATGTVAAVAEILSQDKEKGHETTTESREMEPATEKAPLPSDQGAEPVEAVAERQAKPEPLPNPLLTRKMSKKDKRKNKKKGTSDAFEDTSATEPSVETTAIEKRLAGERPEDQEFTETARGEVPEEPNPEEEFNTTKKEKKGKKGKKRNGSTSSKSVSRAESPERELPRPELVEEEVQRPEREAASYEQIAPAPVEPSSIPLPRTEHEDLTRILSHDPEDVQAEPLEQSQRPENSASHNINLEESVGTVLTDPTFARPSSRTGPLEEPTYDELPGHDSRRPSRRPSRRSSRRASFDASAQREAAAPMVEPGSRPPPVNDKEFAAVLAAGLSTAGFDPEISQRLPSEEHVEGDEEGFSELHRRQTKGKRSREASPPESYSAQITAEPEQLESSRTIEPLQEPVEAALEDEWGVPVKKSKKKGKKGSKASSKAPSGTATPSERPEEQQVVEKPPIEVTHPPPDHEISEAVLGAAAVGAAGVVASLLSAKREREERTEPAQEDFTRVHRVMTEPTIELPREEVQPASLPASLPARRATDASPSTVPSGTRISQLFPELERVKRKAPVRMDSIDEAPLRKKLSVGSGEEAVQRIISPRQSISTAGTPPPEKQVSAQDLAKPGWSWPEPENRDSAVIMESPQVPQQHETVRDSGYDDLPMTPGNVDERQFRRDSCTISHGSQRSPIRVRVEVSPEWDVSVEDGSPIEGRRVRESIESADSLPRATPRAIDDDMPDRTPPSPPAIESTSKDRSSTALFESSPSTREPPEVDFTSREPVRPSVEEPTDSPPSIFGPQSRAGEGLAPYTPLSPSHSRSPSMALDTIHEDGPESPLSKRARPPSDVTEPEPVAKASRRSETPETLSEKRRQASLHIVPPESDQRALSPASMVSMGELIDNREWPEVDEEKGTVGGIDQMIQEDQRKRTPSSGHPSLGRDSRKVSPMGDRRSPSVVSDKSIGRIKSPEHIRSASVTSNRSDRSLRRVDMSGDLRSASRLSGAGVRVSQTPQPQTPTLTGASTNERLKGTGRRISMEGVYVSFEISELILGDADDEIQEGTGDAPGSPMSPSGRPPSIRKRQSLHIMDLESRLDQLVSENRQLQDAKARYEAAMQDSSQDRELHATTIRQATEAVASRDAAIQEKDSEIAQIRDMVDRLHDEVDKLAGENARLTAQNQTIATDAQRFATLQEQGAEAHAKWQESSRALEILQQQHGELRSKHEILNSGMEQIVRDEIDARLRDRDDEIQRLRDELDEAHEEIRRLNKQIASGPGVESFLVTKTEDEMETACQDLCQHVQQWVLRFSKFSDNRACRLSSEIRDDKIEELLDDVVLDGSDVDRLLGDRVRRRDVFMSVVISILWRHVFSRYLFGLDREQRQKLKTLQSTLSSVGKFIHHPQWFSSCSHVAGPPEAVAQWRAITLTLLSRREVFVEQRNQDSEAVVHEIYSILAKLLPPPTNLQNQLIDSLRNVMRFAVDLSISMRTQRPEYIMMPPLRPEYDVQTGDLIQKVSFNSSMMNERSGEFTSNEEVEERGADVKIMLFPMVIKKGDDYGVGEDETVICPSQVIVAKPNDSKKVVRVMSAAMDIDARQSLTSVLPPGSSAI